MTSKADLQEKSLAQLHALARDAGVERFRMLRREQLVEELEKQGSEEGKEDEGPDAQPSEVEERPRPRRRRRRRRSAGSADEQAEEKAEGGAEPPARPSDAEEVSGVLDVVPAGHGFVRLGGLEPQEGDVYISASQIRRCELRPGDTVAGPARPPRRGERHRALVRVEGVNGAEPGAERSGAFEKLTPVAPHRRIALASAGDPAARAVDLVAPLAFGQRVLVDAGPRSGRTTLLQSLAREIGAAAPDAAVIVLLVDERPEDVTAWRRDVSGAEIAAAPADLDAADQVRHAELAIATAKRRAESGEDVVLLIDSLTRLGAAHGDPAAIKPVFGAGRELEEEGSGSLTVIGTVLGGSDNGSELSEELQTAQNATIALDPELVAEGAFPPIDLSRSVTIGEEALREPDELERVRALRAELQGLEPAEAVARLAQED